MEVENVYTGGAQLPQASIESLCQSVWLVHTRGTGVDFGGDGETSLFPLGIAGKGLLLPSNVHTSGINLVVSCCLEVIKESIVLCKGRGTSPGVGIRAKGHKTKDDPGFGVGGNQRHCGSFVKWGLGKGEIGWKDHRGWGGT